MATGKDGLAEDWDEEDWTSTNELTRAGSRRRSWNQTRHQVEGLLEDGRAVEKTIIDVRALYRRAAEQTNLPANAHLLRFLEEVRATLDDLRGNIWCSCPRCGECFRPVLPLLPVHACPSCQTLVKTRYERARLD